jgi:hypothetical protein
MDAGLIGKEGGADTAYVAMPAQPPGGPPPFNPEQAAVPMMMPVQGEYAQHQQHVPQQQFIAPAVKSLTELEKKTDLVPFPDAAVDSSMSAEYLLERKEPRFKLPPILERFQDKTKLPYKNIKHQTFNSGGDVNGAVARLAANDEEVTAMLQGVSGIDLAKCLGQDEQVIATLPCKGFDGFPDFGESNDQQRMVSSLPPLRPRSHP